MQGDGNGKIHQHLIIPKAAAAAHLLHTFINWAMHVAKLVVVEESGGKLLLLLRKTYIDSGGRVSAAAASPTLAETQFSWVGAATSTCNENLIVRWAVSPLSYPVTCRILTPIRVQKMKNKKQKKSHRHLN